MRLVGSAVRFSVSPVAFSRAPVYILPTPPPPNDDLLCDENHECRCPISFLFKRHFVVFFPFFFFLFPPHLRVRCQPKLCK